MRVLVCGDRDWEDRQYLYAMLDEVHAHQGVDLVIEWDLHHKAAGPIRNQQMLDEGKPDYVVAFHEDIAHSRGTADMVRRAAKAGVPAVVWP